MTLQYNAKFAFISMRYKLRVYNDEDNSQNKFLTQIDPDFLILEIDLLYY
jgi:hypothetical protein